LKLGASILLSSPSKEESLKVPFSRGEVFFCVSPEELTFGAGLTDRPFFRSANQSTKAGVAVDFLLNLKFAIALIPLEDLRTRPLNPPILGDFDL